MTLSPKLGRKSCTKPSSAGSFQLTLSRNRNAQQPNQEAAGPSRSIFRGAGQTLGGDGVESRTIPDPRGSAIPTATTGGPVQERILHIWTDGFSIDDGELRRFDDPQNRADLQMIREGRAPIHLMNVRLDQRVDVKLQQHNEDYRPLPKVYRPFGGEGRRLGSPVPGESMIVPEPVASTTTTTSAPASSSQAPTSGVDESQPTLMLRLQLPDGTRLPARFNTSQTVGDVYDFIQGSSPSINTRPWVLSTTFPNKEHEEKELVLGEMAEFKRGGTAVVKWK
jgi:UBX domain-containing protein 1